MERYTIYALFTDMNGEPCYIKKQQPIAVTVFKDGYYDHDKGSWSPATEIQVEGLRFYVRETPAEVVAKLEEY